MSYELTDLQKEIIEALKRVRKEGKIGMTTREISVNLGVNRAKINLNCHILKERKILSSQKVGHSTLWFIMENT